MVSWILYLQGQLMLGLVKIQQWYGVISSRAFSFIDREQKLYIFLFLVIQVGVGMCMEGIEHNPVVYELMSEMAYRNEKVQLVVGAHVF